MTSRTRGEPRQRLGHQEHLLLSSIDVRGLTHEQKKLIWAHYWKSDKPVDYRNITIHDNVIYVYEDGTPFVGNVARDGGSYQPESFYEDMHKPIFEEIVTVTHKFNGTKAPLPKFIEHEGRQYKLVPVKD